MAQKFKVGDLVYCKKIKKDGVVSSINLHHNKMFVRFDEAGCTFTYTLDGILTNELKPTLLKNSMDKLFSSKDMVDFANQYSEEEVSPRDLVRFLNSRKEVKNEGK